MAKRTSGLRSLDLSHTEISDAGMAAAVPHLEGLTHLRLEGADLTSKGIAPLAKLTALQTLDLRFMDFGDDTVHALHLLAELRSLTLRTDQVTCGAMAEALQKWQKLEKLVWMSADLDCDANVSTMPSLRELWLDHSGVSPAFSRDLGQSATLEVLSLQHTFFRDDQAPPPGANGTLAIIGLPSNEQHGDINGDGLDDLILGVDRDSWNDVPESGSVHVFLGRTSWQADYLLEDADVRFVGTEQYQSMGSWMLVSDMNADGFDDVVVASPSHPVGTKAGETFVFYGQES